MLCDIMFMMLLLFVSIVCLSTCHAVEVEYSKKIASDRKGDWFGTSLATSHHKLVIGAPYDDNQRGSIIVDESVRVKGPAGGENFGLDVDVNQHFMVVSAFKPNTVYVYQPNSPYNMVAKFPLDGWVYSVVISDDNTIAVSHLDHNEDGSLTIYQYDGSSIWNVIKKFKFEMNFGQSSLAMYGDIIVVGVPYASDDQGYVYIFNRVGYKDKRSKKNM